jgi:hypothetical protein
MSKTHEDSRLRRNSMIAFAKEAEKPHALSELAKRFGFSTDTARSCLMREKAPFVSPRDEKKDKMLALYKQGLDCASISKEMGLSSAIYAYKRLQDMGENPVRPRGEGAYFQLGTRKLSRDVPRLIKMLGDLKRGVDTATMQAKYGICRERVSQVRAYGVATGLLDEAEKNVGETLTAA